MDVSSMISVRCCSLFTTADYGYEYDFHATEVPPTLEIELYIVNGADFYEPGSEFNQLNSTDSDNSTNKNIDWKEVYLSL